MYPPATDFRRDGFGCLAANSWKKADEEHSVAINRRSGTKGVTQKVETVVRVNLSPVAIATVDDLRLCRMHFEPTRLQSLFDLTPDELRLRLRPAVNDHIVRVAFKRTVRIALRHPTVERMVQEDVGQQGRRHASNNVANGPR